MASSDHHRRRQQRHLTATGLAAAIGIAGAEATDLLAINTLGGTDSVDSAGLSTGTIRLLIDGLAA